MKKVKVGFIGLGNMGQPMAKNLLTAGYDVHVVAHRHRGPAEQLAVLGATIAETPKQATVDAAFVVTMLPDLPEVEQVVGGENGIIAGSSPGLVLINMSTVSPSGIQKLAETVKNFGVQICDAPVSGGPARAAEGTLTIMAGAQAKVFEHSRSILETLGENIFYTGDIGSGQVAKLCNNMLSATLMAISSEVLTLGVKSGVDAELLRNIILKSSGSNFQLENWMPNNVLIDQYQAGFSLKLMYKDVGLAQTLGREQRVPLFIGNLVHELYGQFMNSALRDADFSVISTFYQDAANVTIANGDPRTKSDEEF